LPTISVVIPCYTLDENLETMAYNSAKSYRFADEIIIVEDGGLKSPALLDIANTYCFHDNNYGFVVNLNLGWAMARGDYVFLVSSDTYIESGDPQDLCIPGRVTSPYLVGHGEQGKHGLNGAFFVVPRQIAQTRGMHDQAFRTYYSDDDYYERVKDIFQLVPSVKFRHAFGGSTTTLGSDWVQQEGARDKKVYDSKYRSIYGTQRR
jgi:glycosyltransferase involved in cell wall biosynthesis